MENLKWVRTDFRVEDSLFSAYHQIEMVQILALALELNGQHDFLLQNQAGVNILAENQTWVITQYQIHLYESPKLDELITMDTRIIDMNPFFVTRRHSLCRDEKIFIEIFTQFAAIDLTKRRIGRLNLNDRLEEEIVDDSYHVEFTKFKNLGQEDDIDLKPVVVESEDIDQNHHVNNLVYLRWAYQVLPVQILQNKRPYLIEVKYDKEILKTDQVGIAFSSRSDLNLTEQVIINQSKNQRASIIRCHWNEK